MTQDSRTPGLTVKDIGTQRGRKKIKLTGFIVGMETNVKSKGTSVGDKHTY